MSGSAPSLVGGQLGRYELHSPIARGGMATVYIGRMSGAAGFSRTVAIKRLHPHLAADSQFLGMFVDEARLAARIRHPNVIDTLDVVSEGGELFIIMDFVLGETLAKLVRAATARNICLPPPVVVSIIIGALEGLHAAHEAVNERGEPLGIVHRDVSPQNILIARDGVPRMLDFGVAKAAGRIQETEGSELKGKLAYMSPEQLTRQTVDRRCDIFAMGVVLWEALTSRRLFAGDDAASTLYAIINEPVPPPSAFVPVLLPALDQVVLRALERDPQKRFATAQEMALALEAACLPAPQRHAGRWVEELAQEALKKRSEIVATAEAASGAGAPLLDAANGSGPQRVVSAQRLAAAPESWRQLPNTPQPGGAGGVGGVGGVVGVGGVGGVVGVIGPPTPQSLPAVAPIHHGGGEATSGVSSLHSGSGMSGSGASSIVSGMSSSGVNSGTHSGPEQKSRLSAHIVAAICGLFAALLVIGLILGFKGLSARASSASRAATTSSSPPPAAAATDSAPPAASSAIAIAGAEPSSTPSAGPLATTATTASAHTSKPATRPNPPVVVTKKSATPTATAAAPNADCENPFTVDANGVKRPKPHCFGH